MWARSALAFNEAELKSFLETARISGNPTVFAYDTGLGARQLRFQKRRGAQMTARGARGSTSRYGSVGNAEKDWGFKARRDKQGKVVSPPDAYFVEDGAWRGMMAAYRRFMDNLTSQSGARRTVGFANWTRTT